jgi:hypothetical protein
MTHDNIKFCLNNILRQAGRRTKIEERHCFTMAFPDNNSKPDITMINSPFSPNKELVIDVTIAAPIPGEFSQQQLSKEAALIPLRAANAAFQKEIRNISQLLTATIWIFCLLLSNPLERFTQIACPFYKNSPKLRKSFGVFLRKQFTNIGFDFYQLPFNVLL